jgi:ribonucleotide reductase beta subunit family protein with ferritin-like domain
MKRKEWKKEVEEWIEEKARELLEIEIDFRADVFNDEQRLKYAKDYIRSLVG